MNLCTKPNCTRPGAVVLSYDYAAQRAILDDPEDGELSPHVYVLCTGCAERLRPPQGWELHDLRSKPPLFLDPAEPAAAVASAAVEAYGDPAPEPARRQLFFGYSG